MFVDDQNMEYPLLDDCMSPRLILQRANSDTIIGDYAHNLIGAENFEPLPLGNQSQKMVDFMGKIP